MATKYVNDTKAGKSISAYVVLNPEGKEVAVVHVHYSDSGVCLVNVFDYGPNGKGFQQRTRRGYGYDKFTAALAGMTIDGHVMSDHGHTGLPFPEGFDYFPEGFAAPAGYELANYRYDHVDRGWRSCHRLAGLAYLRALNYNVIQAI